MHWFNSATDKVKCLGRYAGTVTYPSLQLLYTVVSIEHFTLVSESTSKMKHPSRFQMSHLPLWNPHAYTCDTNLWYRLAESVGPPPKLWYHDGDRWEISVASACAIVQRSYFPSGKHTCPTSCWPAEASKYLPEHKSCTKFQYVKQDWYLDIFFHYTKCQLLCESVHIISYIWKFLALQSCK